MLCKLDYDIKTAICVNYKMDFGPVSVLGLYLNLAQFNRTNINVSVTFLQQQLEKSFKKQQYAKKMSEKRISKKNYQEDKYVIRIVDFYSISVFL